jgi:hypothetical protein
MVLARGLPPRRRESTKICKKAAPVNVFPKTAKPLPDTRSGRGVKNLFNGSGG